MSYRTILNCGTFYFPSWKHYGTQVNVVCDRCYTQELVACVGYMQQDLCMSCVDQLTRENTVGTYIGFQQMQPVRNQTNPFTSPYVNPYDYFNDYK